MSSKQRGKVWRSETDGDWWWTLWISSGQVSQSSEGYRNRGHAVEQFKSLFPDAELEIGECEEDA